MWALLDLPRVGNSPSERKSSLKGSWSYFPNVSVPINSDLHCATLQNTFSGRSPQYSRRRKAVSPSLFPVSHTRTISTVDFNGSFERMRFCFRCFYRSTKKVKLSGCDHLIYHLSPDRSLSRTYGGLLRLRKYLGGPLTRNIYCYAC